MTSRREVLTAVVVVGMSGRPLLAHAERVPRIGFVTTTPMFRDAFIDELRRLGYQDGRDIEIHWRPNPAGGRQDVEDLVKLSPACLVLAGPTNLGYGRELTSTIPIVTIDLETDPVADGIVRSLAHPGGNVTGISSITPNWLESRFSSSAMSYRRSNARRCSGRNLLARRSCGRHSLRRPRSGSPSCRSVFGR